MNLFFNPTNLINKTQKHAMKPSPFPSFNAHKFTTSYKSDLRKKLKKIKKKKEQKTDFKKLSVSTQDSMNTNKNPCVPKVLKPSKSKSKILKKVYKIKKLIGEGANNRVYLAEHVVTKKQYAVKVFRIKDLSSDKKLFYLKVNILFFILKRMKKVAFFKL